MAIGDTFRVNTNIGALTSLDHITILNRNLEKIQLKIATGKSIVETADNPANATLSTLLTARQRGLAAALLNTQIGKSALEIAEGGLVTMVEIITAMREKVVQAANDALGPTEKASIQVELAQRSAEFDDLVDETTFNDRKLLDGTYISQSYQIGENVTDVLLVSLTQDHTAAGLKIDPANVADLVSTAPGAHQALDPL